MSNIDLPELPDTGWQPKFVPPSLGPQVLMKQYVNINKVFNNLTTVDSINKILDHYCNFILVLNGQVPSSQYIDNLGRCAYFGNEPDGNGCKTAKFPQEKALIMGILKDILVAIFKKVQSTNPDLLNESNSYIEKLKKAVEFFCHFIGTKEVDSMYASYILPLVTELNAIFLPDGIITERCRPTNRGYGCARAVMTESDDIGKIKIILLSTSDSGSGNIVYAGGAKYKKKYGKTKRRKYKNKRTKRTKRTKKYRY